jgi:type IV pilus assembly protein PilB
VGLIGSYFAPPGCKLTPRGCKNGLITSEMEKPKKQLGEILIEKGLILPEQLKDALIKQMRTKEFLGAILLRRKQITEKDLLKALSEQFKIPIISIKNHYIDWNFVRRFSASLILEHKCLPLKGDDVTVTVAITNPLNAWTIKKAEEETRGFVLKLVLVSDEDMKDVIERYQQYVRGKYF